MDTTPKTLPTSLTAHKRKKKLTRILTDIDGILKVLSLSQQSLSFFKMYTQVQEIISVLETNKNLFELHRKKYEKELETL